MALIEIESLTDTQARGLELIYVDPLGCSPRSALPDRHSLVLTHIPRTGGVTLDAILFAVAAAQNKSWIRLQGDAYAQYWGGEKKHVLESVQASAEPLNSAAYISGHMPYGIHRQVDNVCIYATVLRDPVHRSWSQVRRIARDDPSIADLSVGDILERGYIVDNQQVRMISGCTDATVICDEDMLCAATKILEDSYDLVGTMDALNRFVCVLAAGLGWPQLLFRRRNASQKLETQPTGKDANLLLKHSAYDEKLYRRAVEIRRDKENEFLVKYPDHERDVAREPGSAVLFSIEPYSIGGKPIGLLPIEHLDEVLGLLRRHDVSIQKVQL